MRDWEKAYKSKRRVFYEHATDTIRQCPENYCLCVRATNNPERFVPYGRDGAVTINGHSLALVLDRWQDGSTGVELAGAIEEAFFG